MYDIVCAILQTSVLNSYFQGNHIVTFQLSKCNIGIYIHCNIVIAFTHCSFPAKDTDGSNLLNKFVKEHGGNEYFQQVPIQEHAFIILHYAGRVKYNIKVGQRS